MDSEIVHDAKLQVSVGWRNRNGQPFLGQRMNTDHNYKWNGEQERSALTQINAVGRDAISHVAISSGAGRDLPQLRNGADPALAAVEPVVSLARACLSGPDGKAIKRKRDNEGNKGGRYNNRRHKPLAHNSSSYNGGLSLAAAA